MDKHNFRATLCDHYSNKNINHIHGLFLRGELFTFYNLSCAESPYK